MWRISRNRARPGESATGSAAERQAETEDQQPGVQAIADTDLGCDLYVSGWVSDYAYTTSGISNQQVSTNRLTVTGASCFQESPGSYGQKVAPADFEADVTRNFGLSRFAEYPGRRGAPDP